MEEFCKFYADSSNKLLYSDIIEKRTSIVEKARRQMLKDTSYTDIDENNFKFTMNVDIIKYLVRLIDSEFFDNNLIKTFEDNGCCISVCLGNTCGSTAGFCSWRPGFKPGERIMLNIKMMPKVFIKSFKNKNIEQRAVDNIPCNDILTCFFITLCHELVHGLIFCNCKDFNKTDDGPGHWKGLTRPGNGHSKTFMSILNNRFGHKNFTHSLINGITVKELEKEIFGSHNIKKGDIVIIQTRSFDGSLEEREVLIISAGKVQLKAVQVNNPKILYIGKYYNSILRKVTYPKEIKSPIIEKKLPSKVIETDLSPREDKTSNKTSSKTSKTSKTTKKIKSKKSVLHDKLIKNLNVDDEVIMNARLPGLSYRSILLVRIVQLNRRKKYNNIKVEIAEGEHKGIMLNLNEQAIVTNPENPVLPASPKVGRELSYKYGDLRSLPLTKDADSFDNMETIDVKEIGSRLLNQIKNYKKFNWINISPKEQFTEDFKNTIKSNPIYFLVKLPNNKIVFADTSGYKYIMYGVIINGLNKLIDDTEFKDVFIKNEVNEVNKVNEPKKTGCTKRNPDPPCKEGFIEKSRPNGSKCCYKGVITKKTYKFKVKNKNNNKRKSVCNKRNPEPPCLPGSTEKKRPNGSICCYKSK